MRELPTLDLSRFGRDPGFLRELRQTAREIGFFYVIGHGVPESLTRDALDAARRFFALPEAEKLKVEMVQSPHYRGYNRPGWELTRGRPDWREQFDLAAERPALPRDTGLPAWARLQGPNQWPSALPEFRAVMLRWQEEATALSIRLVRAFAAALEQPEDIFAPIYDALPNQRIKLIRYPGRDTNEDAQGVGAHKDSGFVTVLLQDGVQGLQVETPDGKPGGGWIDAPPHPGTFIVNIGELLEMASNGYLKATMHRVVSPPAGQERYSIAFFLGAKLDATVPVLDLPPHLAAEARGVTRDPQNPLFMEVGKNYLKSRLRSHPDVARRHYADLLSAAELAAPAGPGSAY
ncbi:MAG: isopenicillin N synthase family oxygenase [Dongia sp.]